MTGTADPAAGHGAASEIPLFRINPGLDRRPLAAAFAANRRVQVHDFLEDEAAATIYDVLANGTRWGLAANPGGEPLSLRHEQLTALTPAQRQEMGSRISAAVRTGEFRFAYHHYPLVPAYLEGWAPGGVHDLLLEHINDAPLMELVREVTGFPELVKGDAQATLYAPNQFLGLHIDSHVAEGWKVAYVMNFARAWREDWGGYLLFYDDAGDVAAGYRPRFNSLTLFAVPQRHAVSYVPPFSPVGRYAITGWFRDR